MLKKTITFKDLDGNELTEDFFFNLSEAELAELELEQRGGLEDYLNKIVKAEDGGAIIAIFKKVIAMSIGKRSDDGRRFIKNDEVRNDFLQTDAYNKVFMELVTDAPKAAEFIRGIVPSELVGSLDKPITELRVVEPAWIAEGRVPTEAELVGATQEQLLEAFRRKSAQSTPQ